MAQVYLAEHLQDKALDALRDPLAEPARFALTKYNATELNVLTATAYFQKNENAAAINLLEKEMELHPDDENLLLACTKAFQGRGFYTNALHAINRQLARTPDDPTWILGKGIASLQVGAYDDSVAALSRMLQLQTNNPDALFNRAVAYLKSGRLDAARADFLNFQTLIPNNLQVAYSLGEIAWRQHATNEVVRNYQMIVANAPTNTPELKEIRERLTQLGVK
jgi:tetratricopeptide (TPR) repeat protein